MTDRNNPTDEEANADEIGTSVQQDAMSLPNNDKNSLYRLASQATERINVQQFLFAIVVLAIISVLILAALSLELIDSENGFIWLIGILATLAAVSLLFVFLDNLRSSNVSGSHVDSLQEDAVMFQPLPPDESYAKTTPQNMGPNGPRNVKTLVFYTPTIKANSFFAGILEYVIDRANDKNFTLIVEKGELKKFHRAGNFTDVILKYSGKHHQNSVLIMIPPRPESYDEIWNLPNNLEANLITLDMAIEGASRRKRFDACKFHKQVILVDNELGARLAAEEVVSFCERNNISEINILVCEGEFHNRGYLFEEELGTRAQGTKLKIVNLGKGIRKLSFSDAVRKARNYVYDTIDSHHEDLKSRATFIFCANDNMALGARMGVSNVDPEVLAGFKDIRIICFDASVFIQEHIDNNDRFLWRAVDQNYTEIVNKAVNSADTIFKGENVDKDVIKVKPKIYRR